MFQAIRQAHILDKVGGGSRPDLPRAVVQHLQPAGAGHEMHVVAANLGVGRALPVVEAELPGRAGDGCRHHVVGE